MVETLGAITIVGASNVTIDNMRSNTIFIRAIGVTRDGLSNEGMLTITNSSFSGPGIPGDGPGLTIDRCAFRNFSSNPYSVSINTNDSIQLTNSTLALDSTHETFFLPTSTTIRSVGARPIEHASLVERPRSRRAVTRSGGVEVESSSQQLR